MQNAKPISHRAVRHEYCMVEMRDGTRRWLGVPLDTPTRLVTTRLASPDAYRAPGLVGAFKERADYGHQPLTL